MKIYLDNCALGRLTDDQRQPRVVAETAAVQAVFDLFKTGVHQWIASRAVEIEVHANSDKEHRRATLERLSGVAVMQELTSSVLARARTLRQQGFGNMDALHLAAALQAGCDVLLTTDDRFIRLAARTPGVPSGFVLNPGEF